MSDDDFVFLAGPPMTRDRERVTPPVLAGERRDAVALLDEHHARREGDSREPYVFTCDDCPRAAICHFAFDPYNLNGDCLDSK